MSHVIPRPSLPEAMPPARQAKVTPAASNILWPGGALAAGRLHEIFADDRADAANAMTCAAVMALSVLPPTAPLLWLRIAKEATGERLYGPGLRALGLDPARIILGQLPDALAVLRAGVDGLRCSGLGAVLMDLPGRVKELDLTATRRMTLAAEASGVTPIMLRIAAAPAPSAAYSRWSVTSAPAQPLAANAPGHTAFTLNLLRRRDGAAGQTWEMAWDGTFLTSLTPASRKDIATGDSASLSGAAFPMAVGGSLAAHARRGERAYLA